MPWLILSGVFSLTLIKANICGHLYLEMGPEMNQEKARRLNAGGGLMSKSVTSVCPIQIFERLIWLTTTPRFFQRYAYFSPKVDGHAPCIFVLFNFLFC